MYLGWITEEEWPIDRYKDYVTAVFSHGGSSNTWIKNILKYVFQRKMSKDFWPKISQESAYINFNFKKSNREIKKLLSFMMCHIMVLVKYYKLILLSSQNKAGAKQGMDGYKTQEDGA